MTRVAKLDAADNWAIHRSLGIAVWMAGYRSRARQWRSGHEQQNRARNFYYEAG